MKINIPAYEPSLECTQRLRHGEINIDLGENVVEVVRCKDCQYWQDKNSKGTQGICLCGKKDMNYSGEFYPFENDFCSYGERKDKV